MCMRGRAVFRWALTFVLLLGIFLGTGPAALAAGEVTVQVKDVTVSAGQTVTTELIMKGTFASFQGVLVYDTDALTLEKVEATSLISGSMTIFKQENTTGKFLNGSFVSAAANDSTIDGAVLTFTFTGGSNAKGTYSFSLEEMLVYDAGGAKLTIKSEQTPVEEVTDYTSKQDSTPSPIGQELTSSPPADNAGTDTDSNNIDSDSADPSGGESDSIDPDNTDPEDTDPDNTDTEDTDPSDIDPDSSDADNTDLDSADTENTGSDKADSNDNSLVVILLIVAAVVVAGIVLTVVIIRKRNKTKGTK